MTDNREPVRVKSDGVRPTLIALLVGGVVILLGLLWFFSTNRNPDQDKLGDNVTLQANAPDPEKRCSSKATYDFIKRDLFRRAAQLRGTDQGPYDRLAAFAVLRMDNPVMESEAKETGGVNCSGTLSLDLPPDVAVVGGKRTLSADVDYTVQPAADGSGDVVLLRNADAIVAPLATLARLEQPTLAAPAATGETVPAAPGAGPQAQPPEAPPPTAPPRPAPQTSAPSRPSFSCANASTRGEIAVCSDSGLAALDVNMAAQYRRALLSASPEQRALLQRTRDRFLAYRDRCPNRQCMADAYVGRMREIRDIMEDR